MITWSPTVIDQISFTELGVKGQFIVQYDVDHKSTPNQVLVCLFLIEYIYLLYTNTNRMLNFECRFNYKCTPNEVLK